MACPTCNHTMQGVGNAGGVSVMWCPRCGTVKHENFITVPKLVERCQRFEKLIDPDFPPLWAIDWHYFGIGESIHKPEDRPNG
jgi:hypothetical protein